MVKTKKHYKLHSFKLDEEISEQLELFCKETGMTKTAVIEKGTTYFINAYRAIVQKTITDEIKNQAYKDSN